LSLPRYRLGDTLELTGEAPQCPYLGSGWWSPEPLGTWSASRYAELRLRLDPPPQRDLLLTARLMPLVAESHRETSVELAVNRMSVGQWTLTKMEPTTEQIRIPLQRVPTGEMLLRLSIEGPPSPAAMGWSNDSRELGVLLSQLRIEEVSPPLGVN
jgi:hypothetical protein